MESKNRSLAFVRLTSIFLAQLVGCTLSGDRLNSQPRYFASPQQAVSTINDLLRKQDWATLSRYYDLAGSAVDRSELESGRFFIRSEHPANPDPAGLWRYRHPFPPGSVFDHERSTEESGVVRIVVAIEIDEGGGIKNAGCGSSK